MISVNFRLYEKLGEHDHAATAYTDFVVDEYRNVDRKELSHAYIYLTQYHLKREQLDQANHYAQKCLQFDETKEEAKVLLRTIAEKRAKVEETSMVVSKSAFPQRSLQASRRSDLVALFQVDDMNETDPVIEQAARTDAISGSQLSPMNLSFTPTP